MAFLTAADVIIKASGAAANDSGLFDSGATGSDRLLLVVIVHEEGSDPAVSAITYGGESLTKEEEVQSSDSTGFAESLEVWYLVDPPTGSNTVQLTNSSTSQDFGVFAAVYTGRDQTTPIKSANNVTIDRTNDDDGTMTITKPTADDEIFWAINQDRGSDKVWSLETDNNSRLEQQFGGAGTGFYTILGDRLTGSGSVSVGATQTYDTQEGPHDMVGLAIVLQPASSGVSGSGAVQASTATMDGSGQVIPVHTGSGTPAAQRATMAGAAERIIAGVGSPTAQRATATGVAERTITAAGTPAAQRATMSGAGAKVFTANGALVAQQASIAGTVVPTTTATGAMAAQQAEISASATLTRNIAAALQAANATLTATGDAYSTLTGSGVLVAQQATLSADAAAFQGLTASGVLQAQQATLSGAGTRVSTGDGVLTAQEAALAASVAVTSTLTGTGDLTAASASLEATGLAYSTASGTLGAAPATLDGEGAVVRALRTAEGELQAQSAHIVAQILRTVMGSGTMGANAATADVYPWIELHTQDSEWEEQLADWGKDL